MFNREQCSPQVIFKVIFESNNVAKIYITSLLLHAWLLVLASRKARNTCCFYFKTEQNGVSCSYDSDKWISNLTCPKDNWGEKLTTSSVPFLPLHLMTCHMSITSVNHFWYQCQSSWYPNFQIWQFVTSSQLLLKTKADISNMQRNNRSGISPAIWRGVKMHKLPNAYMWGVISSLYTF